MADPKTPMTTVPDPISHDEIAALVDSTRQWVAMMLKRFGQEEIVAYRGRNFRIIKSDRLRQIVRGDKV